MDRDLRSPAVDKKWWQSIRRILHTLDRQYKFRVSAITAVVAVTMLSGNQTYAQSICSATADPILKYRLSDPLDHSALYRGYDSVEEAVEDSLRMTMAYFLAHGYTSLRFTYIGPGLPMYLLTMIRPDGLEVSVYVSGQTHLGKV